MTLKPPTESASNVPSAVAGASWDLAQELRFRPLLHGVGTLLPVLRFLGTKRLPHILVLVVACGTFGIWYSQSPALRESLRRPQVSEAIAANLGPENWSEWLDRWLNFVSVGTLVIATLVWWGELRQHWEESRPNRMSAYFLHQGKPAIIVRNFGLAGADDVRAWSQQVGSQACGGIQLSFDPDVLAASPRLGRIGESGEVIRFCAVAFNLTARPQTKGAPPGAVGRTSNSPSDASGTDEAVCRYQPPLPLPVLSDNCCRYWNFAEKESSVRDIATAEVEKLLEQEIDWHKEELAELNAKRRVKSHPAVT